MDLRFGRLRDCTGYIWRETMKQSYLQTMLASALLELGCKNRVFIPTNPLKQRVLLPGPAISDRLRAR
jgi:hypothetical protein